MPIYEMGELEESDQSTGLIIRNLEGMQLKLGIRAPIDSVSRTLVKSVLLTRTSNMLQCPVREKVGLRYP